MIKERPIRSNAYQHLMHETFCSDEFMNNFSNSDSIENRLNPFTYNEEVLILQDQLKVEFWRLAENICTNLQFKIISLIKDGYTQWEIAKHLGVNQSSVTKSINGNISYGRTTKQYGGILKKMKKAIDNDEKFQALFKKIGELEEEKT